MKKLLAISLLAIFCVANTAALARTKYTSRGEIIDSSTLRGRKTAAYEAKIEQRRQAQAAAAARLNYEEMAKAFSNTSESNKSKK